MHKSNWEASGFLGFFLPCFFYPISLNNLVQLGHFKTWSVIQFEGGQEITVAIPALRAELAQGCQQCWGLDKEQQLSQTAALRNPPSQQSWDPQAAPTSLPPVFPVLMTQMLLATLATAQQHPSSLDNKHPDSQIAAKQVWLAWREERVTGTQCDLNFRSVCRSLNLCISPALGLSLWVKNCILRI